MKLAYVIDYIFRRTPDGEVWTDTSYDEIFWQSYVEVFGKVCLVCRIEEVEFASRQWRKVTGPDVEVAALPAYRGPIGYLMVASEIRKMLVDVLGSADAVILRVPSNLSRLVAKEMKRTGIRYGVEVVGDPYDALAPGIVNMPGRALLRSLFTEAQKSICAAATGVAYVAACLRKRYPEGKGASALVCSDVRLSDDWLRQAPRHFVPSLQRNLLTVATLSQTYKGIDILLRAIAKCRQQHFDLTLTIVGVGKERANLERLASQLHISEAVKFVGAVPWGPELIDRFDQADMFVLPSRVEAMPRALIEAMARGLPVIATDVGAIHEVLDREEMVTAGDSCELSQRIIEVCRSSRRLEAMSTHNLARAQNFAAHLLYPKWRRFQHELKTHFEAA